jgi:hypothetical protein
VGGVDAVRASLSYHELMADVLKGLGATQPTLERAAAEVDALADAVRDSEPATLQRPLTRPPSISEIFKAQLQTAATSHVLAARSVSGAEHAHLFSLVAINFHLATDSMQAAEEAHLTYRQWLALRNQGGDRGVLWEELHRWQYPAWEAHLRNGDSHPTSRPVRPDSAVCDSVAWLVDRVAEEAELHGVATDPSLVDWLAGPDEIPGGLLRRRAVKRRFASAVVLSQHAIQRSMSQKPPRATWVEDQGPYPPVSWCGHWLNATNAQPRSWVANVVAHALDTWPPLGPARPHGATRRPYSWPTYIDRYLGD